MSELPVGEVICGDAVPLMIWFHGTDAGSAASILAEGFRPGTYFSTHLESALAFGGNHVFHVALRWQRDRWQRTCLETVLPSSIVLYEIFAPRQVLFYDGDLAKCILDENLAMGPEWYDAAH